MIFDGLKQPKNLTQHRLMTGITDFGDAAAWNEYQGGRGQIVVVSIPKFLEVLGKKNTAVIQPLLDNYVHLLEHEFKGIDGIENITSENMDITDGISTLNVINKVNQQSATTLSMRYTEKSGSIFTKVHELFLKGICDPRSQVKTYHGLIKSGDLEPGLENEIFTLLYFAVDETFLKVERAFLLLCGQPTTSQFDIYNMEKGNPETKEINVEMQGFLVEGSEIAVKAQAIVDWMNSDANPNQWKFNSDDFMYTGVEKIDTKVSHL